MPADEDLFEKLMKEAWEAGKRGKEYKPPAAHEKELSGEQRKALQLHNLTARRLATTEPPIPAGLKEDYKDIVKIGQGATGKVYKALEIDLNREVAIKVLKRKACTARFRREAQRLAEIEHPHVVRVYKYETKDRKSGKHLPRPWIVTAWVDGETLHRKIIETWKTWSEKKTTEEKREWIVQGIEWMKQCCRGMIRIHHKGIIHRDLKPGNIMIDTEDLVKIIDLGHSKKLPLTEDIDHVATPGESPASRQGSGSSPVTEQDSLFGTPDYMAPEQAADPTKVNEKSDIYGFGCTFYHLLTGRLPFPADTDDERVRKHRDDPLISPRSRNPDLSRVISELLERCLAKDPDRRFGSFQAILNQLERIDDHSSEDSSPWDAPSPGQLTFPDQWSRYQDRKDDYLRGSFPDGPDEYKLPNGKRLIIEYGDIVTCRTEALVSADSPKLPMSGGVSKTIRMAAGKKVVRETRTYSPIAPGKVTVTSAGDLPAPARFIFHAVTLEFSKADGSKKIKNVPSRDLIHQLLEGCFAEADKYSVKSIAFPLLGAGFGGLDEDVSLSTIFHDLLRRLSSGPNSVNVTRIVIWNRRLKSA